MPVRSETTHPRSIVRTRRRPRLVAPRSVSSTSAASSTSSSAPEERRSAPTLEPVSRPPLPLLKNSITTFFSFFLAFNNKDDGERVVYRPLFVLDPQRITLKEQNHPSSSPSETPIIPPFSIVVVVLAFFLFFLSLGSSLSLVVREKKKSNKGKTHLTESASFLLCACVWSLLLTHLSSTVPSCVNVLCLCVVVCHSVTSVHDTRRASLLSLFDNEQPTVSG